MSSIRVLGTEWCGDCTRAKAFFAEKNVAYDWVDVDVDQAAHSECVELNGGKRVVPTIIFEDGDILVEPSNEQLAQKLGL